MHMYMYRYLWVSVLHDNIWDGKKERKKDTWGKWINENELPRVGFEPTTLCTLDRCSYQLNYQGSPAGRVQIKHCIHLCEQANWNSAYKHVQLFIWNEMHGLCLASFVQESRIPAFF